MLAIENDNICFSDFIVPEPKTLLLDSQNYRTVFTDLL